MPPASLCSLLKSPLILSLSLWGSVDAESRAVAERETFSASSASPRLRCDSESISNIRILATTLQGPPSCPPKSKCCTFSTRYCLSPSKARSSKSTLDRSIKLLAASDASPIGELITARLECCNARGYSDWLGLVLVV